MSEQVIEIPSKRIYDNQNPKIIKNKYTTSSIDMNRTGMTNNYGVQIGNSSELSTNVDITELPTTATTGNTGDSRPFKICDTESASGTFKTLGVVGIVGVYSGISNKFHNVKITIPKKQNYGLKTVLNVKTGFDGVLGEEEITPDIQISVLYDVYKQDISTNMTIQSNGSYTFSAVNYGERKLDSEQTERITDQYKTQTKTEKTNDTVGLTVTAIAKNNDLTLVRDYYNTPISQSKIVTENADSYLVSVIYGTYKKIASMSCSKNNTIGQFPYTVRMDGIIWEYIPKSTSVTVYGDTIEVYKDDYVYEYGDETHANNIFNPESNELFQNNTKVSNKQIDKYMSDTVLGGWQNGKETAEIQCSVNDYKSIIPLSGKVGGDAISTSDYTLPFMFRVGNVVCPMKATVSGDKPISTFDFKWDGSTAKFPKLFRVTGISPKYDGALWQTLTLQETYPQYDVTIDTTNAKGIAGGSLKHNITSSRCTKGGSSTKPHYGDTMYIEFRVINGYTAEMNISGSIGTTYKNITKSTASQNRYIAWVYGIADDFDVTITTEFAMTPPIFASIYLNDDNTWAYRDIVNKNNYQVNCKVTVIVDGKVTARDEWRILANSYWDIGEGQSPAAFGSVGRNGIATIKAEFSYTTTQNEIITKTSTMQIGGKLAQPEIVYAEFYSNDGQSYVEVEVFNPCPVAVDMGVAVEDENSQVAYKQQRVEAYSNEVIQLDVTSSLDYINSRVRARSTYFSGSSSRKPFVNSDSTYSQID